MRSLASPMPLPEPGALSAMNVPAPAKLNLFLHVTGRRADGYHLLQSLFVLIDWADGLDVQVRADGELQRHDVLAPGMPALPDNDLCLRAAQALRQASGCRLGAAITLRKRLPSGAGLGGGSSDAASVLLALNRLWGLHWPRRRLLDLGVALGADVPFFVGGQSAWVEGIGERLTPLDVPTCRFLVAKPPQPVPTEAVFRAPRLKRDTAPAILESFLAAALADVPSAHQLNADQGLGGRVVDVVQLMRRTHNDLQPVAQVLCPQVGEAIDWLIPQVQFARMTGSGSAAFGLAKVGDADARGGADEAPFAGHAPAGWLARWCHSLPKHPLVHWADDGG